MFDFYRVAYFSKIHCSHSEIYLSVPAARGKNVECVVVFFVEGELRTVNVGVYCTFCDSERLQWLNGLMLAR